MVKGVWDTSLKPIKMSDFGYSSTKKSHKRTSCPKAVKETVWKKYIGNKMNGKCYVCSCPITYTNFEVGHNKAHSKGGKWSVLNCRPVCRTCNRSMGSMSIEAFKKKYFTKKPTKRTTKKRPTKRNTLPTWGIKPIKLPKIRI